MRSTFFKNWVLFGLIALSFSNECISGTLLSTARSGEKSEFQNATSATKVEEIALGLGMTNTDSVTLKTDIGIEFTLVWSSSEFPEGDARNKRGAGLRQAPNGTIWYTVSNEPLDYPSALARCEKMGLTMPSLEKDFSDLDKTFNALPPFLSDQNISLWTSSKNDKEERGIRLLLNSQLGGFSQSKEKQKPEDNSSTLNLGDGNFAPSDELHHFCCILKPDVETLVKSIR